MQYLKYYVAIILLFIIATVLFKYLFNVSYSDVLIGEAVIATLVIVYIITDDPPSGGAVA